MSEIVGGLSIKELAEGGAIFEIKNEQVEDDHAAELEYLNEIEKFTKLELLDFGNGYDGEEPFDSIARKMENLLSDGKIKKIIIREGYGSKPEQSSYVKINYNAYVQYEANPFDSTYGRKDPFSFSIGEGQVIEGLDIAVQSMKLNEKAQFLIDPELAYRKSGLERIPPNSTVFFEIELCGLMESVGEDVPEVNKKEFAYVYPFCLGQCVKGKRMFRLKDYHAAIKEYHVGARKLEEALLKDYEDQLKSDELLVRLYTNLLICHTHVQNPKKGCIFAQQIYQMEKNKTFRISAKVFFNHAKCLRMLGQFGDAERKLHQAKKLEPRNPEILQEFSALMKEMSEKKKREVSMGKALVSS